MIDIFGKTLKGYLNGDLPHHVVRGKNGYFNTLNTEVYFANYSDWEHYEAAIITRYIDGRVLDIGAGAGRHSLFLQDEGFEVHAIDISPSAVALMKTRGVKNVYLMNLNSLDFPENCFDSVLIMFADLGLGGTVKDTKKLLKSLYKITTPKGKIITTIRNPGDARESQYFGHYKDHKQIGKTIEKVKARIEYNGEIGDWFSILMASPEGLDNLIENTGWIISNTIKGDDGFYGVLLEKEPHKVTTNRIATHLSLT